MSKIKQITASEILDSRGNPTIEVTVVLQDGTEATADCPSGASVGTYEAVELRDHDEKRYNGLGVLTAISNIESVIAPKLLGMDALKQQEIDKAMIELDGTQNKSRLGANATLSVSMAVAKAAAKASKLPLFLYLREYIKTENTPPKIPTPAFNIINGGKHALNNLDFQEFMIIPATAKPYHQALQEGVTVYHKLKQILSTNGLSTLIGDEGGYGPATINNEDCFSYMKQAVEAAGLRTGYDMFFGIDAAANSFYENKKYQLKGEKASFSADEMMAYYEKLNNDYRLLYLEDPLCEEEWNEWAKLSAKISTNTIVVGDDLTVTNPYRLQMALDKKAITGIIIKPNQIGTVMEAMAVVEVARHSSLKIIVSHRSGETQDSFIADFAVAVSADYVKFGAPARGERVAKYNRLSTIEKQLQTL